MHSMLIRISDKLAELVYSAKTQNTFIKVPAKHVK